MISKAIAYGLSIALAASLAALGVQTVRLANEKAAHAESRSAYADQVAMAEAATRAESEKNRTIEQELRNAEQTHAAEAEALRLAADRARADGNRASSRLLGAAETAALNARAGCAASTSTELRKAADDSARMLAHLLGLIDERAGILADVAEGRGIAGRACERLYNEAVTRTN